MTHTLNMVEVAINTLKNQIERYIAELDPNYCTQEGKVKQTAIDDYMALNRLQKALTTASTPLTTAISSIYNALLELIKNNTEVTEGKHTLRLKTSQRKNIAYKGVLEEYTPLLNLVFNVNLYTPEEFHERVQILIKELLPVSDKFASIPMSISQSLEVL